MFITNFGHLSYIEFDNYSNNLMTKENVSAVKEYGLKVIGTIANNPLRVSEAIGCGVSRFTSDIVSPDIIFPIITA